jgi:hypothetical protein
MERTSLEKTIRWWFGDAHASSQNGDFILSWGIVPGRGFALPCGSCGGHLEVFFRAFEFFFVNGFFFFVDGFFFIVRRRRWLSTTPRLCCRRVRLQLKNNHEL